MSQWYLRKITIYIIVPSTCDDWPHGVLVWVHWWCVDMDVCQQTATESSKDRGALVYHHSTSSPASASNSSLLGPGHAHNGSTWPGSVYRLGPVDEDTRHEDCFRLLCRAAPAAEYPSIGLAFRFPVVGSVLGLITSGLR